MLTLLIILGVIALLDSLSMVPLAVLPMAVALGGARPFRTAGGFVAGMYVAYFSSGIVLVLGMDALFERFGAYFSRLWNQPNALELGVQVLIGVLLVASSCYLKRPEQPKPERAEPSSASPGAFFVLGATLIFVGIPGAVPYAAAVERIVRYDPGWLLTLLSLLFYNLLFVTLFLVMMLTRYAFPQHSERFFAALARLTTALMPKLVAALFFLGGLLMVVDGVAWLTMGKGVL